MTKRTLASLMCPYYGKANASLIRCAEPRSARLRAARAKGSQKLDRSGAQRTPGEFPEKPQRGRRRPRQRSPREFPEMPQRTFPERTQRICPEAPKEALFGDPYWCQNVWFSIGFIRKTETCDSKNGKRARGICAKFNVTLLDCKLAICTSLCLCFRDVPVL